MDHPLPPPSGGPVGRPRRRRLPAGTPVIDPWVGSLRADRGVRRLMEDLVSVGESQLSGVERDHPVTNELATVVDLARYRETRERTGDGQPCEAS